MRSLNQVVTHEHGWRVTDPYSLLLNPSYSQDYEELKYMGRLRWLDISSLERRWLRGDLILTSNTSHGRHDLSRAEFFEAAADWHLRGRDFKLRARTFRFLHRRAAYSVRPLILWKKLQNKSGQCSRARCFDAITALCINVSVPYPSLTVVLLQVTYCMVRGAQTVPLYLKDILDRI